MKLTKFVPIGLIVTTSMAIIPVSTACNDENAIILDCKSTHDLVLEAGTTEHTMNFATYGGKPVAIVATTFHKVRDGSVIKEKPYMHFCWKAERVKVNDNGTFDLTFNVSEIPTEKENFYLRVAVANETKGFEFTFNMSLVQKGE